jgi:plastocyanin
MTDRFDRRRGRRVALASVMLAAVACGGGGGGGSPSAPSSPSATPSPVASDPATTITIASAGVSPKEIQVAVGGRITFVNNDNAFHEMSSDPHPIHTDCPEINSVGAIGPGTTRQTAVFTRATTCGYHDHGQDTNTALQGRIVVR